MLTAVLLALGLTAADAPAATSVSTPTPTTPATPAATVKRTDAVLVMDLRAIDVAPSQAKLIDGLVATAVARQLGRLAIDERPPIHTMDEFRTLADVEAQRFVAGCDDGSASCLAELAGALGARYVVNGTLGVLGKDVVLQLNLLDTRAARTLARASASRSDVSDLQGAIDDVVMETLAPLLEGALPSSSSSSSSQPSSSSSSPPWGLIAGGTTAAIGTVVAGVGFGGLFLFDSWLAPTSTASVTDKEQALRFAWPALWVGVGGAAVAVTGVVVAVALPGGGE